MNERMNGFRSMFIVYTHLFTSCGKRWKMLAARRHGAPRWMYMFVYVRMHHTHHIILRRGFRWAHSKPNLKYHSVYINPCLPQSLLRKSNFLKIILIDWIIVVILIKKLEFSRTTQKYVHFYNNKKNSSKLRLLKASISLLNLKIKY